MTNDQYYIASSSILRYLNQVSKHNRLTDAQIKKVYIRTCITISGLTRLSVKNYKGRQFYHFLIASHSALYRKL